MKPTAGKKLSAAEAGTIPPCALCSDGAAVDDNITDVVIRSTANASCLITAVGLQRAGAVVGQGPVIVCLFQTGAVLAASLISHYTGVQLDGIMAVAVAGFILYSGAGLVKDTMDPLLGNAPSPELVEKIRRKILSYPGVLGTHDLIVHDYGHGRKFATVHVEMAAEENVIESHAVIDQIERDFLSSEGINMLIHFDPVLTDDSAVSEIRRELEQTVRLIDERLSVHDLRLVSCGDITNAEFDVAVPTDFKMDESELRAEIERFMSQKRADIRCVITVDRSFAAIPPDELPRKD